MARNNLAKCTSIRVVEEHIKISSGLEKVYLYILQASGERLGYQLFDHNGIAISERPGYRISFEAGIPIGANREILNVTVKSPRGTTALSIIL